MELYSILKIKPSFKGTVEDVSPQMTGWVQCALSCCLTVQQLARVSAAPSLTRLPTTTTHHSPPHHCLQWPLVTVTRILLLHHSHHHNTTRWVVSLTETGTSQDARHISELSLKFRLLNCFWFCILCPLMKVLLYSTTITKVSSWSFTTCFCVNRIWSFVHSMDLLTSTKAKSV